MFVLNETNCFNNIFVVIFFKFSFHNCLLQLPTTKKHFETHEFHVILGIVWWQFYFFHFHHSSKVLRVLCLQAGRQDFAAAVQKSQGGHICKMQYSI